MEAAGCTPAEVGKEPGAAPTSTPLQPLVPAHERGAVSRVDAGRRCTLAGPAVAVGGGGGGRFCAVFLCCACANCSGGPKAHGEFSALVGVSEGV